jgi:hypothetical protein
MHRQACSTVSCAANTSGFWSLTMYPSFRLVMILPSRQGFGFLKTASPERYFTYHIAAVCNLIRVKLLPRPIERRPRPDFRFGSLADICEGYQRCPLYPQKRTCSSSASMSVCARSRHFRTPQLAFTNGCVGPTSKHTLFMVPVKKRVSSRDRRERQLRRDPCRHRGVCR